jgi:hypothetical protein
MNLGLISIHWSYIETSLDALVAITYHHHGGNKIERELPRMLGRKIKYLRRAFARAPSLAKQEAEAVAFLDKVAGLSDRRHVLIHGYASEYAENGIKFVKLRIERHFHHIEEHFVSAAALVGFAGETGELSYKLAEFVRPLTAQLLEELGKKAGGEVTG